MYSRIPVGLSSLDAGVVLVPRAFLVLISVGGWVGLRAIVWLVGLGKLKNPKNALGIESPTF
jgi:hypothetical protein